MRFLGLFSLVILFAEPVLAQAPPPIPRRAPIAQPVDTPPDQANLDKAALESAGLKANDPASLIDYIRTRTLSDTDLTKIQVIIQRLGSDDFDERLKAANEVERFGPAAVGPLRAAFANSDYEIAYRARECLKRMEKVPHAEVATAAVRSLAQSKHPEAARALMAFLPMADTPAVVDEIRTTLVTLAVRDGKPDPAVVDALKDGAAIRRSAAAGAIVRGNRAILEPIYPQVRAAAQTEKDPDTRFQMIFPLLTLAQDKPSLETLLDVLPDLPRGRLWQAEDYLLQLAGADAPKALFGKTRESMVQARDLWQDWWTKTGSKKDLSTFNYQPQISGSTLVVFYDQRFGTPGTVTELGPDLKERWRLNNLSYPMDAAAMGDGTYVVAESSSARVTIRNTKGDILATKSLNGVNRIHGNPQHVEVLPSGNILVTCQNLVVEFKKDKDELVWSYLRNNYDIRASKRLPSGETMLMCQNGPNHAVFLDDKGKEIPNKRLKTSQPNYAWGDITLTGPERVLVTEMNQVVEYDLKEGKPVWSRSINQARSVQRLPNGNTLLVDGLGRLIEFAPSGEEVWTYQVMDGPQIYRATRR